jgi:hypothetical protein
MIRPTQGYFDVCVELENPGSSIAVSVSVVRVFFGVVADPQSYLNIFYLMLAFPLGIAGHGHISGRRPDRHLSGRTKF